MATSSLHLHRREIHYGWSRDYPPVRSVASGTELSFETQDASGGQLRPGSTAESVSSLDFDRVNPVCGPVFVEGARAGDVLQVDVLAVAPGPGSYGWTALIPGFGLLADRFVDPWLHIWEFEGDEAVFTDDIRVPIQPFCGVLGVAPALPGTHSVIPPRRVGGNLDTRQLGPGTTLYLPVEVDGALFGVGDTHAAQGDGEVCGTAIEAAMTVSLRLSVLRDRDIETPEFDVTTPLERAGAAAAGYHATTGVAPDLMEAARQSITRMIVHLGRYYDLSPEQAYALSSVAVDLRISEVVDTPNWVVSAFLAKDLFRR
jgi:acetamidase/formamidase